MIGMNATHLPGCEYDDVRFLRRHEIADRILVRQIELRPAACDRLDHLAARPSRFELPEDSAPDQSPVASHKNSHVCASFNPPLIASRQGLSSQASSRKLSVFLLVPFGSTSAFALPDSNTA
jgi:hypothetical protein